MPKAFCTVFLFLFIKCGSLMTKNVSVYTTGLASIKKLIQYFNKRNVKSDQTFHHLFYFNILLAAQITLNLIPEQTIHHEESNNIHFTQVWVKRSCNKPDRTATKPTPRDPRAWWRSVAAIPKCCANKFCERVGSATNCTHSNGRL